MILQLPVRTIVINIPELFSLPEVKTIHLLEFHKTLFLNIKSSYTHPLTLVLFYYSFVND
jgi:hypothetical protein